MGPVLAVPSCGSQVTPERGQSLLPVPGQEGTARRREARSGRCNLYLSDPSPTFIVKGAKKERGFVGRDGVWVVGSDASLRSFFHVPCDLWLCDKRKPFPLTSQVTKNRINTVNALFL